MVLLGLSFAKVGQGSKFNICQDSLFSVDTTLPSAEASDDLSVATNAVTAKSGSGGGGGGGDDDSSSSCSVFSTARLNSILASNQTLSLDSWKAQTTKERVTLAPSTTAATASWAWSR